MIAIDNDNRTGFLSQNYFKESLAENAKRKQKEQGKQEELDS